MDLLPLDTPLTFSDYANRVAVFESNVRVPTEADALRMWRLRHAVTGLTTEVAELMDCLINSPADLTNAIEEACDLFWYGALAARELLSVEDMTALGITLDAMSVKDEPWDGPLDYAARLVIQIGAAADVLKRREWYDDPGDRGSYTLIPVIPVVTIIGRICVAMGPSPRSVLITNYNKLATRYKKKFDKQRAVARDLAAERTVLEKSQS